MSIERNEYEIPLSEVDQRGHDHFAKHHPVPFEERTGTVSETTFSSGVTHRDWDLDTFSCQHCGAYPRFEYVSGQHQTTTACEFATGAVYGATIQIPSGKMVITDSLFKYFPAAHKADDGLVRDISSVAGRKAYTEILGEKHNLAYGFTSMSPNVYLDEETGTRLMVGGDRYDEETDEDIHPEGWRLVASISTGLWAYTIADYDDYIAHGGSAEPELHEGITFVDVPAGAWEFTYLGDRPGWQEEEEDDPEDADDEPVLIALAEFKPSDGKVS